MGFIMKSWWLLITHWYFEGMSSKSQKLPTDAVHCGCISRGTRLRWKWKRREEKRGKQRKGRGECNTWQGGCQVRQARMCRWNSDALKKRELSREVYAPDCLPAGLPAWWSSPGRWEKGGEKRKTLVSEMVWERKVWSCGDIHRGNGISLEEVASLLYLMRWRRSGERVKESVKEVVIRRME